MRVLVTGAAGFIGSHLADALCERHTISAFDNFLTGSRENWPSAVEIDIVDRKQLYEYANAAKPELIIHCAASYSDPDLWHRDTQTNVEGAINVSAIARHHDARIIYFQTILPPLSSYAISKIAAEQYLRLSGQPVTVFRLANVYGPRNLSGPIPVFYKRITNGQPCVVVDTTRDMVFVADVVDCVQQAIEQDLQGTFDVCSGVQSSIGTLFREVAFQLGHAEDPPLIPPAPDDVQGTISRRAGLPGWQASTPLREGIARTISYYQENGVHQTHTHLRLKG